jgi:hypothetical protein
MTQNSSVYFNRSFSVVAIGCKKGGVQPVTLSGSLQLVAVGSIAVKREDFADVHRNDNDCPRSMKCPSGTFPTTSAHSIDFLMRHHSHPSHFISQLASPSHDYHEQPTDGGDGSPLQMEPNIRPLNYQ